MTDVKFQPKVLVGDTVRINRNIVSEFPGEGPACVGREARVREIMGDYDWISIYPPVTHIAEFIARELDVIG